MKETNFFCNCTKCCNTYFTKTRSIIEAYDTIEESSTIATRYYYKNTLVAMKYNWIFGIGGLYKASKIPINNNTYITLTKKRILFFTFVHIVKKAFLFLAF